MTIAELLKAAESPTPWRIDGDRIRDAYGELVTIVSGADARLIVALVNQAHQEASFDELDDSFPNPFGKNALEEEMYKERIADNYTTGLVLGMFDPEE